MLEVRQRPFLEDSLDLEKRMEPAVSARFLRIRRGGETGLSDGIPGGFYLQWDGGRQLSLMMKGHVIVLGRKRWKVPQIEGEDNIQVSGEQLWAGWRQISKKGLSVQPVREGYLAFRMNTFILLLLLFFVRTVFFFFSLFHFMLLLQAFLKVSFNIGKERGGIDFDSNMSLWAKENLYKSPNLDEYSNFSAVFYTEIALRLKSSHLGNK